MQVLWAKYFYLFVFLMFGFISESQTTRIRGKITDSQTGEALPYVNIVFKGKTVGTISDFNGFYKLETNTPGDSLVFSYMGYAGTTIHVAKGRYQELNVKLDPINVLLDEVVIRKSKKRLKNRDNPAIVLLDKMIANRKENNLRKLDYFQYENYTKIQFDINNIDEKFMNRRVLKPFKFVFDYIDTSAVNGKTFLPVFIIESISDFYYRKNPQSEKEFVRATKVSGIENESIQRFLADMYVDVSIFDNYIDLFSKGFVNPVSSIGKLYYKYFLLDSSFIDNSWCYQIAFLPRVKEDLLFDGNFWVSDTSFAVKKIELKLNQKVNLNFITNVEIMQEFEKIDSLWVVKKETFLADFNLFENQDSSMGFFGKRTTMRKNIVLNVAPDEKVFKDINNVVVSEDANQKDEAFWNTERHEALSEKEVQIYQMVDTIKTLPAYRAWYGVISTFVTGYFVTGNIELGPYFSTFSFNPIEGNRFRFGGRTSNKFSTKIMPEFYLAYGTKDEQFKYGANVLYMVKKDPRRAASIAYKNDMEQLGQSVNAFREDNIMSSMLRRTPNDKLSMVEETKMFYDHEWFHGFSNKITLAHRKLFPVGDENFTFVRNGAIVTKENLRTSEIVLSTRFAHNETFFMGEFERVSLGTRYPVVNLHYTFGLSDILAADFSYQKAELSVLHWVNMYPFGYFKYFFEAGKIWGELPFPLLKIHEGNETWAFDMYSYNMMNYYEFVSDKWISLYFSHYFEGFFLNKLPLFRKLKWREVVWGKGLLGSLSETNKMVMAFPETLNYFTNENEE
ncbi:MAG: carboxypeptidase-like regulatory domain-containing protein [Bacteroidales bacterium]|nr:carboxypeptidase-like regulatory domain-containing protein [Bacteroidales bacterium]